MLILPGLADRRAHGCLTEDSSLFLQVLQPDVRHVIVTTGQLIPTLAKLLICGLDAHVPADAIYSARNESKEHCFRLLESEHGEDARYCVIGMLHGKRNDRLCCRRILAALHREGFTSHDPTKKLL